MVVWGTVPRVIECVDLWWCNLVAWCWHYVCVRFGTLMLKVGHDLSCGDGVVRVVVCGSELLCNSLECGGRLIVYLHIFGGVVAV